MEKFLIYLSESLVAQFISYLKRPPIAMAINLY